MTDYWSQHNSGSDRCLPMEFINLQWKIELCQQCRCVAVKSQDGVLGCLKCREMPEEAMSNYLQGKCVYCAQPLIFLMDACLSCGNQPRLEKSGFIDIDTV